MLKTKAIKIIKIIFYFKNFLTVINFYQGKFAKGKKIKIFPRYSPAFFVARRSDGWLIEKILRGEKISVISNPDGQEFIIQDNFCLRQGTSDTFIYKEIYIDGCYRSLIGTLTKDSVVIDLGAHIGLFSLYCAKYCRQIFAYEAHPSNFGLAQKNIANYQANNIKLFNLAAWSKTDETVYLDSAELAQTGEHTVKTSGNLDVKTISLVDIFKQNNIGNCDLLKIDIEGAEYGVLLSASSEVLSKTKLICLECHRDLVHRDLVGNRTTEDLKKFLQEKGFMVSEKAISDYLSLMWARK